MIETHPYIEVTLSANSAPGSFVQIRIYNEGASSFGDVNPADIANSVQAVLKGIYADWTNSTKTYHDVTSTSL